MVLAPVRSSYCPRGLKPKPSSCGQQKYNTDSQNLGHRQDRYTPLHTVGQASSDPHTGRDSRRGGLPQTLGSELLQGDFLLGVGFPLVNKIQLPERVDENRVWSWNEGAPFSRSGIFLQGRAGRTEGGWWLALLVSWRVGSRDPSSWRWFTASLRVPGSAWAPSHAGGIWLPWESCPTGDRLSRPAGQVISAPWKLFLFEWKAVPLPFPARAVLVRVGLAWIGFTGGVT